MRPGLNVPHPPEFSHLGRSRLPMETSVPGMFAAGDVRHGSVKRVTVAAGEGSTAVAMIHEHLRLLRDGPASARQGKAQ